VLTRLGDDRAAVREYEALCTLEPDQVEHFENAATCHHKLGNAAAAAHFAAQAVALDPASPAQVLMIKD